MGAFLETGLSNALLACPLALLAALVGYAGKRPAVTHCLWLLVLLKLVTPPLVRLSVAWPARPAAAEAAQVGGAEAAGPIRPEPPPPAPDAAAAEDQPEDLQPAPVPDPGEDPAPEDGPSVAAATADPPVQPSWPTVAVAVWLAGSLLWFVWTVRAIVRFQRLLRFARPAPPGVQDRVRELARRLGLKRCPGVWLVPGAVSPMLWPVGKAPRLLFPAKLLEQLDAQQQRTLLAHELAHLRRRDHWVRVLELVVLGLYWWHPVAWWARKELREAEEQCCDAWVVSCLAGSGKAYAVALLQTVAFFSQVRSALPAAASGIGQVPHLRRRLTMIMSGKTPRSLSGAGAWAVLGLGLLLPLSVRAQTFPGQPGPDAAGERGARRQQIEALKRAIQILEAQERGEGEKKPKAEKPSPEVAKAMDEVKRLAKEVEARQKALAEAHDKLHAAVQRLQQLGYKIQPGQLGINPYVHVVVPGMRGMARPNPVLATPGYGGVIQFAPPGVHATPGPFGAVRPRGEGGSDLEKRLDRLQKELEELRRELRGGARSGLHPDPKAKPGAYGGFGTPPRSIPAYPNPPAGGEKPQVPAANPAGVR